MIVLVGGSASGKSTVEKELVNTYNYNKLISYTTRPPRGGEVDGVDYYFVSEERFEKLYYGDFFCETAEYNGWHYGTAKCDCTDDKVAVLTPHGLRSMKKIPNINITSFYINVPRRDRLIKILQRGDDIEESYRRSLSDVGQFDGIADEVDYVLHNYGYSHTPEMLATLINRFCTDKAWKCKHKLARKEKR